jgi:hypothetical protein
MSILSEAQAPECLGHIVIFSVAHLRRIQYPYLRCAIVASDEGSLSAAFSLKTAASIFV